MKLEANVQMQPSFVPLRGYKRLWSELAVLFRIQYAIVRDSWAWVIIMATIFPLSTTMFMYFFMDNPTEAMIIRIIAGNIIFGVIVMGMNSMAQDISWQKHQGHFTYYASLPISKLNFVIANLLRGFMSTLPSLLLLGFIGSVGYGVNFHYSWGLPIVIVLTVTSVVGIGVSIGFWSPNQQLTNILVQALMMFVTFLSPVMIDMSQLPSVLQWISYVFPTTYAADAMRTILVEGWTTGVLVDCIVMLGFSMISVIVVNKLVSWRVNR